MNTRGSRAIFCVAVAGLIFSGAAARAAPPGYDRVTVRKAGFSILIPEDWVRYHQTRKDLEAIFKTNPDAFGDLKIKDVLDNAKRTPLRALYNVGDDGVAEISLSVEFQPGVLLLRPPNLAKSELEQGGTFKNVTAEYSDVAHKRAVRAEAELSFAAPSGAQVTAHVVLYFVLTQRGLLSIGFVDRIGADHQDTIQRLIRSVRVLRNN